MFISAGKSISELS